MMRLDTFLILISILSEVTLTLVDSSHVISSDCQPTCGNITIPYPFGVNNEGCYLNEYYKIECLKNSTGVGEYPVLSKFNMTVVNIFLPQDSYGGSQPFASLRVRIPVTSMGCSIDGKEIGRSLNLTGSPYFFEKENYLVAVGCKGKASLTNIEPNKVVCDLDCTSKTEVHSNNNIPFIDNTGCSNITLPLPGNEVCTESQAGCDGNKCCRTDMPSDRQQVIGVKIERNEENSAKEECRVAFLTDERYTKSNGTNPMPLFVKGYSTVKLGWVIQTNNLSFLNSLSCKTRNKNTNTFATPNISCVCDNSTIFETSYASCGCNRGYTGNAYILNGCEDVDECSPENKNYCRQSDTCVNVPGEYDCVADKTKAIIAGVGAGFGVLVLVCAIWWLRKFLIRRRKIRRQRVFFKRNGGLLLQQQLYTREGNVENTKIFSSRTLEKATENFSENRILGQGGQGTVYKGMLVDGRTVAVKKSKMVDEDKLEEFINEVVILSQINHRHVVKLLGCCLETEVPILVYEFIPNGNLFQHIHEEFDDYTMIWGVRMCVAVDIAGALSYLHYAACSPIYHRDIKSTNILLDEKYRAKVSDFGTSRSITVDQTHWTTVVSGTVGYVDPEYYGSSQYTDKSDVYSFGVVLAELITGEKPVVTLLNSQEIKGLADYFRVAMKENRLLDIIDARIRDGCKTKQVVAVANLAKRCLNSKGKKRPNMRQVFTELEKICLLSEDAHIQMFNHCFLVQHGDQSRIHYDEFLTW
ncbi:unnamed protein product [Eruca vesicaria subsp. sativa]|uniref:Protein kinase domain-containing protein n=1 Tax=Eruca vesicaria subsp. sativa TaxID=29727 RepID=A0ABC8JGQ7_ERUVS|nr:unnamed protein product [Eruca vesicaria subsp. sativa]